MSVTTNQAPPAARPAGPPGRSVPVGGWLAPGRGETPADVFGELAGCGVVLLGESHDEAEHHRWQLHTIAALFSRRPGMVLGFEMFPRRVQPALERWSAGELNEAAFLREVDWTNVWGFDPALYLPLFHFARMHRLPVRALNVDRATSRLVVSRGLAAVPAAEREGVGEPAPAPAAYRSRLFEWFKQHPAGGAQADAGSDRFARFVGAQLLWDRAMAEAIAAARRHAPLVVGIVGRGHVEYREGIVRQLAALGVDDVRTALPWPADINCPPDQPPVADLLFGVAPSLR